MNYQTESIKNLNRLYCELPLLQKSMCEGFYRASFIGPLWLRLLGKPSLDISGLPNWQGKKFLSDNTATNVLIKKGQNVDALEMSLKHVTSYVDGSDAQAFCYEAKAPMPWRWVRDELRAIDENTILGVTFIDLPLLRNLGLPFLLERE